MGVTYNTVVMGVVYNTVVMGVAYNSVIIQYKEEKVAKAYEQELKEIVERDPLAPMFEQDKELVWRFRMYLLENLPASLPKLLNSVKWSQHKDVAVVSK